MGEGIMTHTHTHSGAVTCEVGSCSSVVASWVVLKEKESCCSSSALSTANTATLPSPMNLTPDTTWRG